MGGKPSAGTQLKKKVRIKAPVERVWAVIEAVERAPEWNPLLTSVRLGKNKGRGVGGTSTFEARVSGISVTGQHEVKTFKENTQYAANCSAEAFSTLRLSVNGEFILKNIDDRETDLTAILSVNVPKIVAPLIKMGSVQKILGTSLDNALSKLGKLSAAKY